MKLTIDLESRSKVDLKKRGMYVYAEDPSTDILCFSFKRDNEPPELWVPEKFLPLCSPRINEIRKRTPIFLRAIEQAEEIEAHNAGFEAVMWAEIMVKRYGFPELPLEKLYCSAAKAAYYALPRALGEACSALGVSEQKDKAGYQVMMRMCKPRKPTKYNKSEWNEDQKDFEDLCLYCMQDVNAEYALSQALPPLPEYERKIWLMDQVINRRGIPIDVKGVTTLKNSVAAKERELLLEMEALTLGSVKSARQRDKTLDFLNGEGVAVSDLRKDTVVAELESDGLSSTAKRVLEIRQSLGKSSVSKLDAMLESACRDNRVRGAFMYAGATTGRWAGKMIQPQNFPRDSFETDDEVDFVLTASNEMIEVLFGCPMQTASKCLRGMIKASGEKYLIGADFSAIEARVLAWLANESKALKAYRDGLDIYKVNAVDIFGVKYENVDKGQRQIGKVSELSLGYQGYTGAFDSMARNYGVILPEERQKEIIHAWRESRPMTVALWKGLENAALMAVKTKQPHSYGSIKYGVRGNFLHCRLPSGRLLSYPFPSTAQITDKYNREKEVVTFYGVDTHTKKWSLQKTYGGSLTENVVQAIARDILAEAMPRIEKRWPIVMHVHDESLSETDYADENTVKEYEKTMAEPPAWALDCPIDASGWFGKRYRK